MDVRDLPLPERVLDHFEADGITELYPPQRAAVEAGVAEGESVVAAVPTASGKTLIAQAAMLSTVETGETAIYVVPLRALATEKYETFDALPGLSVGIATGDYDATDEQLAEHDVVVATSEKVDAAVRHGSGWVEQAGCVVLDEAHLLDDPTRGPTLEVTVAKLRRIAPSLQIVALSATVPNAREIADWLDATAVRSDWRPVDLRTGLYDGSRVEFTDGTTRPLDAEDATTGLVRDAIVDGGGCLVFVNSRRSARELAANLATTPELDGVRPADDGEDGAREPAVGDRIRATATTATGRELARIADCGVAFHHAGLRTAHRRLVEDAFRERELAVICATPTLAAGVNVPARRVVVRDWQRYDERHGGVVPLSTLEIQQMMGRAGRPGLDPYGEAIVVADEGSADTVRERYLTGTPDPVTSHLDDPEALRPHVLSTVASGVAEDRSTLRDVLAATFGAHTDGVERLDAVADDVIVALRAAGMLRDGPELAATELGELVSRVYVDPGTGADVVEALSRAAGVERVTALTVCEIVCDTAEMPSQYVRQDEAGPLSTFALRHEGELAKPIREFEGDFHDWLSTLKTARLLVDYADGTAVDDLAERYRVGPGDVRRIAERAEWLLTATESLAEHVDSEATERIRETRQALIERTVEEA